jgi:hypothetical protein
MKFGKIFLLSAVLATATQFAFADTITTAGSESGSGITSTGFSFNNKVASGPFKGDATGTISSATDFLSVYSGVGATLYYTPQISGSPSFKFTSVTAGTPLEFYEIISGSDTLKFYLTSLAHFTGSGSAPGTLTGSGYITVTGITGDIPVFFSLTNTTKGTGAKLFTTDLTTDDPITADAPEPSSLVLLGSGVMGVAGTMFRKRRAA